MFFHKIFLIKIVVLSIFASTGHASMSYLSITQVKITQHKAQKVRKEKEKALAAKKERVFRTVRKWLQTKNNTMLQEILKRKIWPDLRVDNKPLIIWAVCTQNLFFYEGLLKARASMNVKDASGTYLSIYTLQSDETIYLSKMLGNGLNPNSTVPDKNGRERLLLWWALYKNKPEHFAILYYAGAALASLLKNNNEKDEEIWKLAINQAGVEPLKLLTEGKDLTNIKVRYNGHNFSLLGYAKKVGTQESIKLLEKKMKKESKSSCIIS